MSHTSAAVTLSDDERKLAELGYKQELRRGWSGFANFAISFTIISVLAGPFTTFSQAWNNGGPIAISIGWPVISLLVLFVALSMAELASAYPTAGGIYYWAYRLGGVRWAWFTGWFNLLGLVAIVASVDYACATFANATLSLYSVNFIFNFATTTPQDILYHTFALFVLILVLHGLLNVFSSPLVSLFNRISVWWHVIGVGIIVVLLIAVPTHHQSFTWVFGHRINNSGFSNSMFWWYVLPLGFLLVMYTFTGYDASAHLSEETENASQAAAKGLWKAVFYSAVVGWIVLLAILFAATHVTAINTAGGTAQAVIITALTSAAAKAVLLISTIGQFFCGLGCVTAASRMNYAFSRDGAVPGHNLWRQLNSERVPTWSVLFITVFALIITLPAIKGNHIGTPVAFYAVVSVTTIALYIAYTIPVYLRWRLRDKFEPGSWTLGANYRWINLIACVWVAICCVIFILPTVPAGVPWNSSFNWSFFNYAPLVLVVVFVIVEIWWQASAKHYFTGPVRTVDEPEPGTTAPAAVASG
jgi:amino acid transporter